ISHRLLCRSRDPRLLGGRGAGLTGLGVGGIHGRVAASAARSQRVSALLTPPLPSLLEWDELARAREALDRGAERVVLEGLWGSARALALAGLLRPDGPACVVAAPGASLAQAGDDLRAFVSLTGLGAADRIVPFPVPHAALWRGGAEREEDAERAAVLGRLLRGEPLWLVTSPRGVTGSLPPPEVVRRQLLTLAVGGAVARGA